MKIYFPGSDVVQLPEQERRRFLREYEDWLTSGNLHGAFVYIKGSITHHLRFDAIIRYEDYEPVDTDSIQPRAPIPGYGSGRR